MLNTSNGMLWKEEFRNEQDKENFFDLHNEMRRLTGAAYYSIQLKYIADDGRVWFLPLATWMPMHDLDGHSIGLLSILNKLKEDDFLYRGTDKITASEVQGFPADLPHNKEMYRRKTKTSKKTRKKLGDVTNFASYSLSHVETDPVPMPLPFRIWEEEDGATVIQGGRFKIVEIMQMVRNHVVGGTMIDWVKIDTALTRS